jgi:hypothetical protein
MKRLRSMMMATAATLLMGAGLASPAQAGVITFEGYADLTVFTTQDFGNGVTFAGATILSLPGSLNPIFPPASGNNVVYNPSGAMTLTFTTPVDFFNGRFTYNQPLSVQAFDSADALLGTANGACGANFTGAGCGAPNELVGVNFAGLIAKVIITGGGGNNFTLDDAEFTGSRDPGVPEPGTMALVLGGLGSVALVRRRRASK